MNIVEMFNGKSNRLEIMALDSDGALYVKKLVEDGHRHQIIGHSGVQVLTGQKSLQVEVKTDGFLLGAF